MSITLTNLIAAVRLRGEVTSNVLADADITILLNESIPRWRQIVMRADPTWLVTSASVSVTAGTNTAAAPTGMLTLHGINGTDSSGQTYSLQKFPWQDRDLYGSATSAFYDPNFWGRLRYCLIGSTIHLRPTPTRSETLTAYYIPKATPLASGSDTFEDLDGAGQRFVILDTLVQYADQRGIDSSAWRSERDRERTNIVDQLSIRDANAPQYMASPSFARRRPTGLR